MFAHTAHPLAFRFQPRPLAAAIHLALAGLLATGWASPATAQTAAASRQYDIPAGPLDQALTRFAQQAGVAVSVDAGQLKGLQTKGLQGSYGIDEGFATLLRGSGYAIGKTTAGYVVIGAASPDPAKSKAEPMERTTELAAIEVRGAADTGYAVRRSRTATRTDTPIEHIPQSIVIVPRQVIEDQAATKLADITDNVSNVRAYDQRDVSYNTGFKVRGFNAAVSVDGVSLPGFLAASEPAINIEQLDVIKGPTGSLYGAPQFSGSSAVGGAIAITSKSPEAVANRQVGFRVGSWGDQAAYFDLNQPINEQFGIRLVGQEQRAESETDRVTSKQRFLAPSLTWRPTKTSQLTLRLRSSETDYLDYTGLPNQNTPRNQILTAEGMPKSRIQSDTVNLQWTQQLNDVWSWGVTGATGKTVYDSRGIFFNMAARTYEEIETTSISPYLTAKFEAGGAKHTVLAGLESVRTSDRGFIIADLFGAAYTSYTPPYSAWAEPAGMFAAPADPYTKISSRTAAYYIQDQIDIDRLHLQLGVRHATIKMDDVYANDPWIALGFSTAHNRETTDSKTLPRVGAVFDIASGVSAFAGYGEDFSVPLGGNYLDPVRPEESKQTEIGLRLTRFHDVTATLALFDLTRINVPRSCGLATCQVGKQNSTGVDIDLLWQATQELALIAAYTHQKAKTVEDSTAPATEGKLLLNVPENAARLALRYDFLQGSLSGLGLGFGLKHFSRLPGDAANTFHTPSATIYDAQASYKLKDVKFTLAINNLLDKKYFVPGSQSSTGGAQVFPAQRRTVMLNTTFTF